MRLIKNNSLFHLPLGTTCLFGYCMLISRLGIAGWWVGSLGWWVVGAQQMVANRLTVPLLKMSGVVIC